MLTAIRQWVVQTMMKGQTGVVRTLPKREIIELNTQMTAERMMRNGINPEDMKNVNQVENVVNQIDQPKVISADSAEGKGITEKLLGKKKAPVFDLEGNKISDGSKIMGGKQVESDAAIKARLDKGNKKGIAGIKKRQLTEDEYQDFLDEIGGADQLEAYNFDGTVGDAKRIIKEQKDYMSQMEMEFRKGKLDPEPGSRTPARKKFLQKKLEEAESSGDARLLSREEREELFDLDDIPEYATGGRAGFYTGGITDVKPDFARAFFRENNAEGGRIGFAGGGMGRRAFLKLMGGVGAGIGALKTGLLGLGGKGATKQVAKELTSVPIGNPEGMPAWFKPLVNKIIKEGDDVTKKFATKDREIVHTKKIDEFEEVTVYQDLNTGNVRLEYGPHLTDDTGKVIRASNEPEVVHLEYKASEVIEPDLTTGKGGGRTKEQFSAAESEPEIVNWEGDIEMSGINEVNKVDDLITDTSKLQKYATGNKLTIKELSDSMNKQKYKNKLETDQLEQINYIEKTHGMSAEDYIDEGTRIGDFDPKGYRNYDTKGMNLPKKKADGGRIGFDGGGSPLQRLRQEIVDSMKGYAPADVTEDQLQLVVKDITLDMTPEQAQASALSNFRKLFGMAEGGLAYMLGE